jgi:uncharacterized protein YndB with AHSA1/START domain
MTSVRVTVDIAAPPERAWQAVADVEDWPRWTTSMGDVKRLDEGPLRVGSRARIKQPGLPVYVWEVTDLDEGTSFTWVARTPGVVAWAGHEVVATADGSRLTLSLAWTGVFGGLAGALMGRRTCKSIMRDAEGHKACAEIST